MMGPSVKFVIVTQVQQMKMFNAQFEKEMSAEGRKNRKVMEKVSFLMPILMLMLLPLMISKIIFSSDTPRYRWKEK